jgi:hypothetical protein
MSALIKDRENLAQNNYDNDERIFNLVITGESVVTPTNTNNQSNTNTSQTQIYTDGTLLKSPLHTSVYYYENGTRRPFPNAAVYYTWFANFNDLKMITVAQMENIKLGNPMPIKAGTKLLKFPYNPKVYEVTEGNKIKHIPNEATATAKFGKSWAKNVIELPEIYYLFYEDVS